MKGAVCLGEKSFKSRPPVNCPKQNAKTRLDWPIPKSIPRFLAVARRAADLPLSLLETWCKTEALLGDKNRAWPHPSRASRAITHKSDVFSVVVVSKKREKDESRRPAVESFLASMVSAIQPAAGATIRTAAGRAIMTRPMEELGSFMTSFR